MRKNNKTYSLRLPSELYAKLVNKAWSKRISVGEYIRQSITKDLTAKK